ncbi:Uncharacterised protein [Mycobacteroides abscessus subsp. abscessus]|nr:Uncharacterised protein [Mycobacteroides abscessus subsp. abscessus]
MVRDAPTLLWWQLGRADVHAAVLLHGVDVDDVAVESFREVEREVGFPGRGRADDGNGGHPG